MTHRDRVRTALEHRSPDRCPMYASFTPEFADRLRADLERRGRLAGRGRAAREHNPHGGGNTYELERALGLDMLLTSVGWANSYYGEGEAYTDEWGIGWRSVPYDTPFGRGRYTEIVHHPLAEDGAIDRYAPPDPDRPELYRDAERTVREFGGEYWIVGVTVTTVFECAWALRGFERILEDFVVNPELAGRILDIPFRYHLAAACRLVELGVDMIWCGDDIAGQRGLIFSPGHWRAYLKPRLAEFVRTLKGINPRLKVAYHSDGVITEVIPELIGLGVDVLNPIQPACLDPAALKRDFGRSLCFWGSVDEQRTLPFGTPADVRREVLDRLATLGRDGGLILAPAQHVQLDTPLENFRAMVDTVLEKA